MKHLLVAATALALAALPALASEATFERTLSVNGKVELSVSTGSGNIHLTPGSGNRVHIFGRVKSGWGGSDERVREIAAHPACTEASRRALAPATSMPSRPARVT